MALPDRPVSGAPIESVWGQTIHDRVLAATGCDLTTATTRTVNSTPGKCHLDVANDDPAGFLDAGNDRAEVPTGAEGLYLLMLTFNSVNGDVGDSVRAYIYKNGTSIAEAVTPSNAGTNVKVIIPTFLALVATDLIEVYAARIGSGTTPTVKVISLQMIRLTDAYGAA